jgi:hypothetical protein
VNAPYVPGTQSHGYLNPITQEEHDLYLATLEKSVEVARKDWWAALKHAELLERSLSEAIKEKAKYEQDFRQGRLRIQST